MIPTLTISAISAASPDMSDPEFATLVADIREHGQLVPIWNCGNEIIDGRKRWRACEILGIEPKVVDLSPGQEPEAMARSLNILRTHYTPSQRAMYGAKRATADHAEAGRRRHPSATPNLEGLKTVKEAAEEVGVSLTAVAAAKAIRREAAPETVSAVEAGKLTLHAAEQIAKSTPKEEQPAVVIKVIEANRGKRRQTATSLVLGKSNGIRRSPRRPISFRAERAFDQLDNALDSIEALFGEGTVEREWLAHVAEARGRLSSLLNAKRKGESCLSASSTGSRSSGSTTRTSRPTRNSSDPSTRSTATR